MIDGRVFLRSRNLLYQDDVGRDAAGSAGGCARGRPSHEVVSQSPTRSRHLEHRGGVCGQSGDGAGLTLQLPQTSQGGGEAPRTRGRSLRPPRASALPSACSSSSTPSRPAATRPRRSSARSFRRPVQCSAGVRYPPCRRLPAEARQTQPTIEQLILKVEKVNRSVTSRLTPEEIQRSTPWSATSTAAARAAPPLPAGGLSAYVPSLSAFLLNYKVY